MYEIVNKSDKFYNIVRRDASDFSIIRNILFKFPDRHRFLDNDEAFEFYKSNVNYGYVLKELDTYLYKNEQYYEITDSLKGIEEKPEDFILKGEDYKPKTPFWKHQKNIFLKTCYKEKYALFLQQRLGKTKLSLDWAAFLFLNKKINTVIVIAPNIVHSDWVNEGAKEHLSVPYNSIVWNSKKKVNLEQLPKIFNQSNKLNIFSINKEAILTMGGEECLRYLIQNYNCALIVDEVHHYKNPHSKSTGLLKVLSGKIKYKRILSGTPVGNNIVDLYSEFELLDKQLLGYSSFTAFSRFCENFPIKAKEYVITQLKNCFIRLTLQECFEDVPQLMQMVSKFELSPEQKKIYKEIKENNFVMDNKEVTLFKNIITKLSQISSGYYLDTEGNEVEIIPLSKNPKIQQLKAQLEITQGKCLIWTKYKKEVKDIVKFLQDTDYKFVVYTGDQSNEEKEFAKQSFKEDPSIKIMILNLQSGSTGLTLFQANTSIYYSSDYSFINDSQSQSRIIKPGTKDKKNIIRLAAIGTIDIRILYLLKKKSELSREIIDSRDNTDLLQDLKYILEDDDKA